MYSKQKQISNWNNYPQIEATEHCFNYEEDASKLVRQINSSIVSRGNGRCYGDASLAANVVSTLQHNHILSFDAKKGIIQCESGILLKDLLDFLVPKGWFLPVTPGTKYITLGGAVASDVHGKNHHKEGSFSQYVLSISVLIENGEILQATKEKHADLFEATMGGMGLTGIVLTVTFQLKPIETAYITQRQIQCKNLDHVINLFTEYKDYTYTMAWIDCLKSGDQQGRSIMFVGEHSLLAELPKKKQQHALTVPQKKKITVPFNLPSFVLNQFSVKAFNQLYYKTHPTREKQLLSYDTFFYPLDSLLEWNRMYGKRGFIQYQFVIPLADNAKGLKNILHKISEKGWGSFLAVLKMFGPQNSLISFPLEGLTLALDFPMKKGLFEFLDELDKIVDSHGGRIYLSKDARMNKSTFQKGYPHHEDFNKIIQKYNPHKSFRSSLSNRIIN